MSDKLSKRNIAIEHAISQGVFADDLVTREALILLWQKAYIAGAEYAAPDPVLPKEKVEKFAKLLDALEFAGAAIEDAILREDGLDSSAAERVLDMIHEQLLKHKRTEDASWRDKYKGNPVI